MWGESENKLAIRNVRVFDGRGIGEPTTVVIDGDRIGTDPEGAQILDAQGAILIPGLIDAHVHLDSPEALDHYAAHGVTTALDMGSVDTALIAALRARTATTTVRSAGAPIIGSAGVHAQVPGIAEVGIISGPEHAETMVAQRVSAGSDYIKVILEAPGEGGPDADTAKAVVTAAHAHNLRVIAHASTPGAYAMAIDAGADILTHVPIGLPIPAADIERLATGAHQVVPTLTMMEGVAEIYGVSAHFAATLATVAALHAAGIPIMAGTDANDMPGIPFHPAHGASLHHELELLVHAGLTPADALNAATAVPARHFGLTDRGTITPGLRADLVLLDADPLADITATRAIRKIWCGGTEHAPAQPITD
ncbi:amidohydrolase family protein [Nocardia tengchongensis]|uniref:amidohydrolase family protein n=1 Tax=Nocardia tengchongensis TaxID=2055889 RepID=UPI00368B5932